VSHHPPPCSPAVRSAVAATQITVELIQPDSMPAAVRVVWPTRQRSPHPPAKRSGQHSHAIVG
jgi:hypothetical protein